MAKPAGHARARQSSVNQGFANRGMPRIDARRRAQNGRMLRQVGTIARVEAIAARNAGNMPGGSSPIPTLVAKTANAPQVARISWIAPLILSIGVCVEPLYQVPFLSALIS